MRPTRDAIVATAAESIARGSRSFSLASRLFARDMRERAWLLYAWCRRCDDLADGQDHGFGVHASHDAAAGLARIRAMTASALTGDPTGDPAFDALGFVAAEAGIPQAMIEDHIAGFALDARGWRPKDEGELIGYCHHVAGVVGQMMALAMGVPADGEETLARARDLGLGFQLANIARDMAEDAARGRCYVPADWLADLAVKPADLMLEGNRDKAAAIAARLADLAAARIAAARAGAKPLPFRSRWAVLAAADIYGAIAVKVKRLGPRAWDRRAGVSGLAKLGHVLRALPAAL